MKEKHKATKKPDKKLKKKHTDLMKNGSNIRNIGVKSFKTVNFSSYLFCPKFLLILSEICQNLVRIFFV